MVCTARGTIEAHARQPFRLEAMQVTIDSRERGLIRILEAAKIAHQVEALPVGDVVCQYGSGHAWVAERKRADDFAASLKDGRWREQSVRLFGSGYRVVYIFEGDFRDAGTMYGNLLGAWMNAELRNCYVFRTIDLEETALVLRGLIAKLEHKHAPVPSGSGLAPPRLSKRRRDGELDACWVRQLMCVPTVSETIARRLLEHFGTPEKLREALRSTGKFPRIQLTEKTALGKARVAILAKYLA